MSDKYRPVFPEGTHLAPSKDTFGTYRGSLLYDDTNQLAGQAEWELVEDDESSDLLKIAVGVAIGVVSYMVIKKTAPHVKRWWSDTAFPSIKKKWNAIIKKEELIPSENGLVQIDSSGIAVVNGATPADLSKRLDTVFDEYQTHMSSKEAQEHLIAILAAAAFIADEMRKLSSACIRDDNDYLEMQSAIEKLTTQKVTDSINLMLQNNISLLDERTSKIFSEIFGGGQFFEGEYVPIQNKKVKEALSFTAEHHDRR